MRALEERFLEVGERLFLGPRKSSATAEHGLGAEHEPSSSSKPPEPHVHHRRMVGPFFCAGQATLLPIRVSMAPNYGLETHRNKPVIDMQLGLVDHDIMDAERSKAYCLSPASVLQSLTLRQRSRYPATAGCSLMIMIHENIHEN